MAAPEFQGVLGPTLFTEVGQTLEVVFQVRRTEHWGKPSRLKDAVFPKKG